MSSPQMSGLQNWNFSPVQQSLESFVFPLHDGGGEDFQDMDFGMLLTETAGQNTGQVSGSGLPGGNELAAGGNGIWVPGSGSGLQGENEVKPGCNRIWEQGSGSSSGLPQVNDGETDSPAAVAVAPQPGKKRNGKGAVYAKNHRDKKRKREEEMKREMDKLRKENEELIRKEHEYNKKLDDFNKELDDFKAKIRQMQQENERKTELVRSLTKSLENMSYPGEENKSLETQQLIADIGGKRIAKKRVEIPLENWSLKIKKNVLHLKRLDRP